MTVKPKTEQGPLTELLILEDNKDLLDQFRRIGQRAGFTCSQARSVESAIQIMKERQDEIAGVVVDLMVPQSVKDVAELDSLIEMRESVLWQLVSADGKEPSKQQQVDTGKVLERVDKKIDAVVQMDGGINFLKAVKDKVPSGRVMLLSTRDTEDKDLINAVSTLNLSSTPYLYSKNHQMSDVRRKLEEWKREPKPMAGAIK